MKKIKVKCAKCGVITLEKTWFSREDEGFCVPVVFCPTEKSYIRFHKEVVGFTPKSEGMQIDRGVVELNHCNPDEDGENWHEHKLEKMECWDTSY